ncbi:MAG: hypothetical protein GX154_12475 [Clostridiales bacterium]|nr:hypothetical protein [Clostridiales bacterium]
MLHVYDKNGEYLGIIKNRFLDRQNAYLIAITDSQPNKVIFNENKLKSFWIFRQHPDTDSGSIRTAYRNYPDSISATSGHLVGLTK